MNGECARRGVTLDQHCHSDTSGGGCRLYWTKQGTSPAEFRGFIEAAAVCRARQKAALSLADYPLPYWAEKAYLIACAVYATIEGEMQDDMDGEDTKTDFAVTGEGDSGAFSLIHQHMSELRLRRTETTYGRKRTGSS